MKNYAKDAKTFDLMKAISIVNEIVADKELHKGGINSLDSQLIRAGYSSKEAEMIERRIKDALNGLLKNPEALEKVGKWVTEN